MEEWGKGVQIRESTAISVFCSPGTHCQRNVDAIRAHKGCMWNYVSRAVIRLMTCSCGEAGVPEWVEGVAMIHEVTRLWQLLGRASVNWNADQGRIGGCKHKLQEGGLSRLVLKRKTVAAGTLGAGDG